MALRNTEIREMLRKLTEMIEAEPNSSEVTMEAGEEKSDVSDTLLSEKKAQLSSDARFAKKHMYLQGMPIFTEARRESSELGATKLKEVLVNLPLHPTTYRNVKKLMAIEKEAIMTVYDNPEGHARITALADMIRSDLAANGERIAPMLLLGLFMASYTIVKDWKA